MNKSLYHKIENITSQHKYGNILDTVKYSQALWVSLTQPSSLSSQVSSFLQTTKHENALLQILANYLPVEKAPVVLHSYSGG